MTKKKVLVVCIGGTVRSVGVKDYLNGNKSCDALAASAIWQSHETMATLCDWADMIIPVEPQDLPEGPAQYKEQWARCFMWEPQYDSKRKVLNLGPDIWGNARDPKLQEIIKLRIGEVL